jgi:hypothetical protein
MEIDDVIRFRDRVAALNDSLGELLQDSEYDVQLGSPAAGDAAALGDLQPIRTAIGQSVLLSESASEHVAAATNSLKEPAQIIACFSCVRTATEVASLSWWLLDPKVDCFERMSRSVALRRKGLDEQKRLTPEGGGVDHEHLARRYAAIDASVAAHRLKVVGVPPATHLVGRVFGDPLCYRLASAVVHGHSWAVSHVGFAEMGRDECRQVTLLRKTAKPTVLLYLLALAVEALGRPLWATTKYVGVHAPAVETLLSAAFGELGISKGRWFWLTATAQPGVAPDAGRRKHEPARVNADR